MKYLVDANVLSEPTKPTLDPRVMQWLHGHKRDVAVDPIILGECDSEFSFFPGEKSGHPWNAGSTWGRASALPPLGLGNGPEMGRTVGARLRTAGQSMPIKDSLIAATALVHGLAVVTQNRAVFVKAGVSIVDPFAG